MSGAPPSVTMKVDGGLWLKILKGISAVVDEANVRFLPNDLDLIEEEDGITPEDIERYKSNLKEESELPIFERSPEFPGVSMIALGSTNASLAMLSLPPAFFKSYFVRRPTTVGINFAATEAGLYSLLKPHLSGDSELTIEIFDDGVACPFIKHIILNQNTMTRVAIKYNFLEIEDTPLETKYDYCAKAVISSQLFHKNIISMKAYGAPVTIGFKSTRRTSDGKNVKSITIACSGMMGQIEATATVHEEEEEEEEEEDMTQVKEELTIEDFVDVFSGSEDYIEEGGGTDRGEEEEIGFGCSSDRGSKRKRGDGSSDSQKKSKKVNALCYSLDTELPGYSTLLAYTFISTATVPVSSTSNIYWGETKEMPFVIEYNLGNGGKLAHVLAPQYTDEEFEEAKTEKI